MKNLKQVIYISLIFSMFVLALSYSGFCFKKTRWLTEEEKIYIAVQHVLDNELPLYLNILDTEEEKQMHTFDSVEDFLQRNPYCCKVSRDLVTCPTCFVEYSFLSNLLGYRSDDVLFQYKYYTFESGKKVRRYNKSIISISNCGVPRNFLF